MNNKQNACDRCCLQAIFIFPSILPFYCYNLIYLVQAYYAFICLLKSVNVLRYYSFNKVSFLCSMFWLNYFLFLLQLISTFLAQNI